MAPSLLSPKLSVFVEDDQSLKGTGLQLCVTQVVSGDGGPLKLKVLPAGMSFPSGDDPPLRKKKRTV